MSLLYQLLKKDVIFNKLCKRYIYIYTQIRYQVIFVIIHRLKTKIRHFYVDKLKRDDKRKL